MNAYMGTVPGISNSKLAIRLALNWRRYAVCDLDSVFALASRQRNVRAPLQYREPYRIGNQLNIANVLVHSGAAGHDGREQHLVLVRGSIDAEVRICEDPATRLVPVEHEFSGTVRVARN